MTFALLQLFRFVPPHQSGTNCQAVLYRPSNCVRNEKRKKELKRKSHRIHSVQVLQWLILGVEIVNFQPPTSQKLRLEWKFAFTDSTITDISNA